MTAHDTPTEEAAYMNARIARLEEDRALRTRELLNVEREVVLLRDQLDKALKAYHYQQETTKLLQAKLDSYQGGKHEEMGDAQAFLCGRRQAPDGLPGEGRGTEQPEDSGGELRRDSDEGQGV